MPNTLPATNILKAIMHIENRADMTLDRATLGARNRANAMGTLLENFIKDAFAGTFGATDEIRNAIFDSYFSYRGSQNNPPDIIIRGGDALEVKKIEGNAGCIALNSSYPKHKIFSDDPKISEECRNCEEWTEKDIIYAIGTVSSNRLKRLWLIYGDCYAAPNEHYAQILDSITAHIRTINGVALSETSEIARINNIDPLAISYLRVRGMFGIQNPKNVFREIHTMDSNTEFSLAVIIRMGKYMSFPAQDRDRIESDENINISDIQIKDPANPNLRIDAKLIAFSR